MKNGKLTRKKHDPCEVGSGNVFQDLALPNPAELLAKAQLVQRLDDVIEGQELSQTRAAKMLGIEKTDLNALLRGNLDLYSVDDLFRFLNVLGQEIEILIRPSQGKSRAATKVVAAG